MSLIIIENYIIKIHNFLKKNNIKILNNIDDYSYNNITEDKLVYYCYYDDINVYNNDKKKYNLRFIQIFNNKNINLILFYNNKIIKGYDIIIEELKILLKI